MQPWLGSVQHKLIQNKQDDPKPTTSGLGQFDYICSLMACRTRIRLGKLAARWSCSEQGLKSRTRGTRREAERSGRGVLKAQDNTNRPSGAGPRPRGEMPMKKPKLIHAYSYLFVLFECQAPVLCLENILRAPSLLSN